MDIEFAKAYNNVIDNMLAQFAVNVSDEYISNIDECIKKLVKDINKFKGNGKPAEILKGDLAEFYLADTFNINAARMKSDSAASVPRDNGLGSVDIETNFGKNYSSKYYKDGKHSVIEQSKSVFDRYKEYVGRGGKDDLITYLKNNNYNDETVLNDPIYSGQYRIIPKGQLLDAKKWLEYKIASAKINNPEMVNKYEETLKLLTDVISDDKGVESISLTNEQALKLAKLLKKREVNEKDLNVNIDKIVTNGDIFKEALNSGFKSAVISMAMSIAPELLDDIVKMCKRDSISEEDISRLGSKAFEGASNGALRGSLSATLTLMCKSGKLGDRFINANSTTIGALTVLAIDSIFLSIDLSVGKISKAEFVENISQELCAITCGLVVGGLLQSMNPEFPGIAFVIGNFIGTAIGSFAFSHLPSIAISFCVETGFTMFGLVKQDYEIPENIINDLCIDAFKINKFEISKFEYDKFTINEFLFDEFKPATFKFISLNRGVIGINKIGYI